MGVILYREDFSRDARVLGRGKSHKGLGRGPLFVLGWMNAARESRFLHGKKIPIIKNTRFLSKSTRRLSLPVLERHRPDTRFQTSAATSLELHDGCKSTRAPSGAGRRTLACFLAFSSAMLQPSYPPSFSREIG